MKATRPDDMSQSGSLTLKRTTAGFEITLCQEVPSARPSIEFCTVTAGGRSPQTVNVIRQFIESHNLKDDDSVSIFIDEVNVVHLLTDNESDVHISVFTRDIIRCVNENDEQGLLSVKLSIPTNTLTNEQTAFFASLLDAMSMDEQTT